MTTRNLDIIVTERGSRVVKRNIEDVGTAAKATGAAAQLMGRALGALAALVALDKIRKAADEYTNLNNRLRLVSSSQEQFNKTQRDVFRIAQQTRSELGATGALYTKLSLASRQLGKDQDEVARFTELFNKTLTISGATAAESAASQLQLAQALGSGRLQGDELRTILESNQRFAIVLSESLGVSIGAIRDLAAEGKITAKEVFDALIKSGAQLDREFKNMQPTMEQAATVISNAFTKLVGNFSEATGLSAGLANAMIWLADKMSMAADAILVVGDYARATFEIMGDSFNTIRSSVVGFGQSLTQTSWWQTFTEMAGKALDYVIEKWRELIGLMNKIPGVNIAIETAKSTAAQVGSVVTTAATEFQKIVTNKEAERLSRGSGKFSPPSTTVFPAASDKGAEKEMERLEKSWRSLQDSLDPIGGLQRQFADDQETLNKALAAGVINQNEYNTALAQLETQLNSDTKEKMKDMFNPSIIQEYAMELNKTGEIFDTMFVDAVKSAGDAVADFVIEGKSLMESFGNILKDIAKQIISLIIQKQILAAMGGAFPGLMVGSANGNVFQGGTVQAFANGGVVAGSTMFPMSNGKMGLMGEAGPEAIMPLERGSDGKLGVRASGGGTTVFSPVVTVNVENSQGGNGQEVGTNVAKEVKKQLELTMAQFTQKQQRPGGMLNQGTSM